MRGRDHGVLDYNSARLAYGLPAISAWADVNPWLDAVYPAVSFVFSCTAFNFVCIVRLCACMYVLCRRPNGWADRDQTKLGIS